MELTDRTRPASRILGLPTPALIGLALLAVPRVILHDLGLLVDAPLLNAMLALGPPVVWLLVVVIGRVPRPFLALLWVGALYGLLLALVHQLLWTQSWDGEPPMLGGNLRDLPPLAHAIITRGFAVVSSLLTGTLVGAVTGVVAWAIERARSARA